MGGSQYLHAGYEARQDYLIAKAVPCFWIGTQEKTASKHMHKIRKNDNRKELKIRKPLPGYLENKALEKHVGSEHGQTPAEIARLMCSVDPYEGRGIHTSVHGTARKNTIRPTFASVLCFAMYVPKEEREMLLATAIGCFCETRYPPFVEILPREGWPQFRIFWNDYRQFRKLEKAKKKAGLHWPTHDPVQQLPKSPPPPIDAGPIAPQQPIKPEQQHTWAAPQQHNWPPPPGHAGAVWRDDTATAKKKPRLNDAGETGSSGGKSSSAFQFQLFQIAHLHEEALVAEKEKADQGLAAERKKADQQLADAKKSLAAEMEKADQALAAARDQLAAAKKAKQAEVARRMKAELQLTAEVGAMAAAKQDWDHQLASEVGKRQEVIEQLAAAKQEWDHQLASEVGKRQEVIEQLAAAKQEWDHQLASEVGKRQEVIEQHNAEKEE